MAPKPPSWVGLFARGLVLTIGAAAAGTAAMLPFAAMLLRPMAKYMGVYLTLGPIIGLFFAAPITLVLLPILRRRGAPLLLPAAVASALWMIAAPRLTGVIGLTAAPRINPDLVVILVGTGAGLASAWLFAAWTRSAEAMHPRP
ncbi:hypothetical protein [Plastoroseomonas hellenica]|uniref:hypothetical protein n=1 Tax=Plastoroseomonas hellenica TaxID=2687306 RepID=UPI001BAC7058|nr:hypothetical protein [Plastoroseomonas hellenica]MBR0645524.1 hypothetical protein [Plastoroseomonas hellenica]